MLARTGAVSWVSASAVVVCAVVAGAVALDARSDEGAGSSAGAGCATQAPDEVAAETLAVECDHEVEVVSARTEWNTLFARPDGTWRLEASAGAIRTKTSGDWTPIDRSLVAVDGGWEVAAAVTPMRFSGGGQEQPLAELVRDGHELRLDVPFALPEPVKARDDQLVYEQVIPGVDLFVTVNSDATGFTEVLRVESAQAAADPRLAELALPVETSGGVELVAREGGFAAVTASGEEVFTAPAPRMWDSRTVSREPVTASRAGLDAMHVGGTAASPVGEPATQEEAALDRAAAPGLTETVTPMALEVSQGSVTVRPDEAMLADSETVWPVYIDPSVDGPRNQWTAVRDKFPPVYNFPADEGVALCDRAASSTCSTTFMSRLMWTFGGLETVGSLSSSQVISATFRALGVHSYSCAPQQITVYRVADFNSTTSWPGGPMWDPLNTQTVAHKPGCIGEPVRTIEWDATGQAMAIADANSDHGSLGLATHETSMAYWKRYNFDATFSVTFNRPPNAPSDAKLTNTFPDVACGGRPYIRTYTPTMSAVLSDPDGDNVHAKFSIYNAASGALIYDPPWTTAQGSGARFSMNVPPGLLGERGIYQWRVQAYDARGLVGPMAWCEFIPDATPPHPPVVTPISNDPVNYPAVYSNDVWGGGVEERGGFRFTDASDDVSHYLYSFTDPVPVTSTPPGASASVVFTPAAVGGHLLTVKAVDWAGNVSAPTTHRILVDFASVIGLWEMDDGSGTVAADTAGVLPAHPLTVNASSWIAGPIREQDAASRDGALTFGPSASAAVTDGPVLKTADPFSVMATVRLDSTGTAATAVGADGFTSSGFELGYRTTGCPAGMAGCWAFAMSTADAPNAATTVAASSLPVTPGEWVHLTGVFDGTGVRVYACQLGTAASPGLANPVASDRVAVPAGSVFSAGGDLAVGRGQSNASPARPWAGTVADVRAYLNGVDMAEVRMACQSPR